jgi:hypothetical protein
LILKAAAPLIFGQTMYRNSWSNYRQRLTDGLGHDLGLVIAKAVHGQVAAEVPAADIVRPVCGGIGMTDRGLHPDFVITVSDRLILQQG